MLLNITEKVEIIIAHQEEVMLDMLFNHRLFSSRGKSFEAAE